MTNELNLRPGESKQLLKRDFQTAHALMGLLDVAVALSNQDAAYINVELIYLGDFSEAGGPYPQFTLTANCLTDGSIVYDIEIE